MEEVPILYLPAKENEFCNEEGNKVTNLWKQKDKENAMAAHSRDAPEIIIDSGCLRHMCGAEMKQYMMEWHHGPRVKVTVADGKTHKSNLYGTITATVTTKTGPQDVKIDNILYIDKICNMLLSVSRFVSATQYAGKRTKVY
jgi:hypothetical protein